MRAMVCLLFLSLIAATIGFATPQKQTFGIATFQAPAGWKQEKGAGFLSFSKIVGQRFGQIVLYEAAKSQGDINSDFDEQWKALVANGKDVSNLEKTKAQTANGWTVMSGSATWKLDGSDVATIFTVYSNQKVCVAVLINFSDPDLAKEYVTMLESMSLDASKEITKTTGAGKSQGLVGLWVYYINESQGFQNGYPILTAGYFRREYLIKADGTYTFRAKDWSVFVLDILFVYETGTWKANGNQITFKPTAGSGGWWAKAADGRTKGWGKFKKGSTYKPQSVTYTYDLRYLEGNKDTYLFLKSGNAGGDKKERSYSPRSLDKSMIDNPPDFKVPVGSTKS